MEGNGMSFIAFCQKAWRPFIGMICALSVLYFGVVQWILAIKFPEMKLVDGACLGVITGIMAWLVTNRTTEKIATKNNQDAK
jgi:hypothetical protein